MGVNSITAMAKNPIVDIRIILEQRMNELQNIINLMEKPGGHGWEKEQYELQ